MSLGPSTAAQRQRAAGRPQDHVEQVLDLAGVLDLSKPGIYPVRVVGDGFLDRGIRHGDILIAAAAADPAAGKMVVAVLHGSFRLARLERQRGCWYLVPGGKEAPIAVAEDIEVWAIVAALVRESV